MAMEKQTYSKKGHRISWTKEEIDFVFDCLSQGLSASATATYMTEKGIRRDCAPITRNVIVGVWSRNPERKKEAEGTYKEYKAEKRVPEKKNKTIISKVPIPPRIPKRYVIPEDGVPFEDLKNSMCRFPFGEPVENIRYCGHPVNFEKSKSYCKLHYAICYQTTRK